MKKTMIVGMLLTVFCGNMIADTVEMGQKIYSDVMITGIDNNNILFIQAEKVRTEKPLSGVTKIKMDMFPDFTKAEELAALSKYPQAMKQYLESYKKINTLKTAWQAASDEHFENNKKELSEIFAANAKSDWIKDLIKIRYAKAKTTQSGGSQQSSQQAVAGTNPQLEGKATDTQESTAGDTCKECRGKGTVKCKKCNGSGHIKCDHIVKGDTTGKRHSHYYETCPRCDGKGKITETYDVWIPGRTRGTKYIPGYNAKRTRPVSCPNDKCFPYPKDPRIHIIWMCPLCATTTYPGYVDCPDCDKGRCKCDKCNGTGKTPTPAVTPATSPAVTPAK